jgi:hypothetical protein
MRSRVVFAFGIAALTGAAVAVLPALAAAPPEVKLEVNQNCEEPNWPCWAIPGSGSLPPPASKITVAAGGEVMFTDKDGTAANIAWTGAAPVCSSGVPVSPTPPTTHWEGRCKFEQPGTYKFESSTLFNGGPTLNYTKYEIVVESAPTGTSSTTTTTTTAATTRPPTTSEPGKGHESPLEGGSTAVKLARTQRGSTVRGSIDVPQADSGGRLEVDLLAASASLARARHAGRVRVGRLVRSSLKAGSESFAVPLSTKGKASLRRRRRLALTVQITVSPLHGAGVTLSRRVVLRA